MTSKHVWPEQKQLAVSITVLIETWTEGRAPPYSVQTTQLKWGTVDNSAITWAQHGGNEGVWRLLRILNHFGIPGTFAINAKCVELYPEAIKATVRSGHEIAAHGYYQDQLHTYMERGQERNAIRSNPKDFYDVFANTFDFLRNFEPMAMLPMTLQPIGVAGP